MTNGQELSAALAEALDAVYADGPPMPAAVTAPAPIPEEGLGEAALPAIWREIIAGTYRRASPWMVGHMDTVPHRAAVLTDAVAAALNINLMFREISQFASRAEEVMCADLALRLGLGPDARGIFCSGGSLANLTALFAAVGGFSGGIERSDVALFLPESGHVSLTKSSAVLGLPAANTIRVRCDDAARIDVAALRAAVAASRHRRKIVVGVLGTTIHGSVDDLSAIAAVARAAGAWFHIDAIYGGALAFSHRYRHFLAGVADADSVVIGPKKWLQVPQISSVLLLRSQEMLDRSLGSAIPYSASGEAHRGRWGLQGSRRGDALVLWALLQVVGSRQLGASIDAGIDLAQRFHTLLCASARSEPLHRPDLNLQAFRHGDHDRSGDRVRAAQLRLAECGRAWVSISSWQGETVFRTVLNNPLTTEAHLDDLLATLDRIDP